LLADNLLLTFVTIFDIINKHCERTVKTIKIKRIQLPLWADVIIGVLFPVLLAFVIEMGHIQSFSGAWSFVVHNPGVFIFDIFLIGMIFVSLSMLLKKLWLGALICSIVFFTFSGIEYYKFNISGSHFLLSDLALTQNISDVALFADLKFNGMLVAIGLFLALYIVAMWYFDQKMPLTKPVRIAAFLGVILVMSVMIITPCFGVICTASGVDCDYTKNTFQDNERFAQNLLTANLAVNVNQMINSKPSRPQEYSEEVVEAIIQDNGAENEKDVGTPKINVITIMSESFADFRDFLSTYSVTETIPEGTYDVFDELLSESMSGMCVVPTFGGGTVKSEFELLFGLPMEAQGNPSVPLSLFDKGEEYASIPSLYRDNGYSTAYMHPFSADFYERIDYYSGFGFDALVFEEDMSVYLTPELLRMEKSEGIESVGYYHNFVSDESVFNDALTRMEYTDSADYIHITTMQNHMPYGDGAQEEANYFEGIKNSTQALYNFIEGIKQLDEPTVVLYVGDHYPFFSDAENLYKRLGISDENCEGLYKQKYLIWNNAGIDFNELPLVSSYYLPCVIAREVGIDDSFYQAILSQMDACPVYSPVIASEGTKVLKILSYDRVSGGNFSE